MKLFENLNIFDGVFFNFLMRLGAEVLVVNVTPEPRTFDPSDIIDNISHAQNAILELQMG